jgi:selenide,water dikinase
VRDPEIKFGYAVTGLADPGRLLTNAAGRVGDLLVLTKPLGTGIIATALKAGHAPLAAVAAATRSMKALNRDAAEAALRLGVRAATDVTGFGLAGHAAAIARESRLTLELELNALPLLPGARELAPSFQPAGLRANRRRFEAELEDGAPADEVLRALLYDPQTSGGLLLLVGSREADALLGEIPGARLIGRCLERAEHPLRIR